MTHVKWKKAVIAVALVAVTASLLTAAPATPRSASAYHRLQIFARVLSHLEQSYVEPVDSDALIYGAIRGMVRTLDPHSSFLMPEDFEILEADTRGEFGGVGLEVGIQGKAITVITPMSKSPAERAGIEPGDQLITIDGRSTETMDVEEAIRLMRGKPGTQVRTSFLRVGAEKPFEVTLTREIIRVESVLSELLAPGFPWIRVRAFQDGTTADVKKELNRLKKQAGGLTGILLDLRRNPGGLLAEAVLLSDLFISKGVIVSTRGQEERALEIYRAERRGTIEDVPLVVLIDGASASAAEIVAGALQDHGRALLVGTKSYGKGSVQSLIDLGGGFGLKLTVARYFTPRGRSIQVEGVVPDIVVESRTAPTPDAETAALAAAPGEGDLPGHLQPNNVAAEPKHVGEEIGDYQLRIALQLLNGLARGRRAEVTP